MRKKLKEVVMNWRNNEHNLSTLEFSHRKKAGGKSFKARVEADTSGNPIISLLSFDGYNQNYVKRKLNYFFQELNQDLKNTIRSGDRLLTRYSVQNPPEIGEEIYLPSDTYYYGVNDGLVHCNGIRLRGTMKATFVGTTVDKCNIDANPIRYTIFKLI